MTAATTTPRWWEWALIGVLGIAQSIAATAFVIGLFWFCGWGMS